MGESWCLIRLVGLVMLVGLNGEDEMIWMIFGLTWRD